MSIDNLRQKFVRYITWIDLYLKSSSGRLNDQSLNVHIEYTIIRLLNHVFGYKLKNANIGTGNFKAIDAIDEENGICFQITSNTRLPKIHETVNKFHADKLYKKYKILYFFYLRQKPKLSELQLDRLDHIIQGKFDFDNQNLIDFMDLLERISHDYSALEKSIEILERELPLLELYQDRSKISLGISLGYTPDDIQLELIKKMCNLMIDSNLILYCNSERLVAKIESNGIYYVKEKQQLPELDLCLIFLKNDINKEEHDNCIILNKSVEGQTLIQNISFESIEKQKSDLIATNCYKLINENNIYLKTNKSFLMKGGFLDEW